MSDPPRRLVEMVIAGAVAVRSAGALLDGKSARLPCGLQQPSIRSPSSYNLKRWLAPVGCSTPSSCACDAQVQGAAKDEQSERWVNLPVRSFLL